MTGSPLVFLSILIVTASAGAQIQLCAPTNDQQACDGQCPGPLPCNPTRIRYNSVTGQYRILACDCEPGCHVQIPSTGQAPVCAGGCADNRPCRLVITPVTENEDDYQCVCYDNEVVADDFVIPPDTNNTKISRLRWWGSYLDPNFEPPGNLRNVDGWFVALHADIPEVPCPSPTGQFPFDLCGTVFPMLNCPPSNIGFQPDGSSDIYLLLGYTGPFNTRARICGSLVSNCNSQCTFACVQVAAVLNCNVTVSRPGALLGQWAFPPESVQILGSNQIGCDQHRVFTYNADFVDACIVHNSDPAVVFPDGFRPQPGVTYWISIQAEVGKHWLAFFCDIANTDQFATRHFWGWHTTPVGYHNKDDAFLGALKMGCFDEWVYDWRRHLHWSDPLYQACADDPTKSIDMAFFLIEMTPQGLERIVWYQPPLPAPAATTGEPPRLFPPGGVDTFPRTGAIVEIQMVDPPLGNVTLNLAGPTVVARANPIPGGATDFVPTEILSMNLVGSIVNPNDVSLRESSSAASSGLTKGPSFDNFPTSESFFDVFVEIDVNSGGFGMVNRDPVHIESGPLSELPPVDATYVTPPATNPIPLYDRGDPTRLRGYILRVEHNTGAYRGGIDIHSDTDFLSPEEVCLCEGDMNGDGKLNGEDIKGFIPCYLATFCGAPPCPSLRCRCLCADMSLNGIVNEDDLNLFVFVLLNGTTCQ